MSRAVILGQFHAEFILDERGDGLQLGTRHFEGHEVFKNPLLQCEQHSGQRFFIKHRIAPPGIGSNIVDIFNEDYVRIDLSEVPDQRPVSRRTEEQPPVCPSERRTVGIHGQRVGRRVLHGEGDAILDPETGFVTRYLFGQQRFETGQMLGRDGKVNLHLAPGGGVLRPFDQMLFDGFAHLIPIAVERHQSLRGFPVTEPFGDDIFDRPQLVGIVTDDRPQLGPEGEAAAVGQQLPDYSRTAPLADELEQILEHTGRGARSGHEFHHPQRLLRTVVTGRRLLDPGSIQHPNTVAARSGPRHGKKGKTFPKILQLGFESRRRQAVLLHLHKILFRKHIGNRLSVTFILFQQDRRHIDRRPTKRAIKNSDSARFSLHAHGALPACYKKLPSHSHRSKPLNDRSPCPTQRPTSLDRKRRIASPFLSAGQKSRPLLPHSSETSNYILCFLRPAERVKSFCPRLSKTFKLTK